jgi:DNA polymerase-4
VRPRAILHVDLDAFYASVEQRDDPSLRGRPVIVGGSRQRGVVCAASYEARPFGVRSAMPMAEAMRRCPKAVVLPPRMGYYGEVSSGFFSVLHKYSPLVEGLSLDEAFLDVTGEERLWGDGPTIARKIKDEVRGEINLIASVGVAPTKFLAKIASDLGKPDGLLVVKEGEERAFLHPLPVGRLWGVGQKTEKVLADLSLRTIGDVARAGEAVLALKLGREQARHLALLSAGVDARDVIADRAPVSVGHEDTFDRDQHVRAALTPHLLDQADRVCARLRELGLRGRTITLKVKYADHQRVSRRRTLERATSDGQRVGKEAVSLLDEVPDIERRGVRLTGVNVSGFESKEGPRQLTLDEPVVERAEQLGAALDQIAHKFGRAAVRRAVHLASDETDDE